MTDWRRVVMLEKLPDGGGVRAVPLDVCFDGSVLDFKGWEFTVTARTTTAQRIDHRPEFPLWLLDMLNEKPECEPEEQNKVWKWGDE